MIGMLLLLTSKKEKMNGLIWNSLNKVIGNANTLVFQMKDLRWCAGRNKFIHCYFFQTNS